MNAKIERGAGYFDVTNYPYGGNFRRAKDPIPINLMGVYSTFNDGSPKDHIAIDAEGRKLIIETKYIELILSKEADPCSPK